MITVHFPDGKTLKYPDGYKSSSHTNPDRTYIRDSNNKNVALFPYSCGVYFTYEPAQPTYGENR